MSRASSIKAFALVAGVLLAGSGCGRGSQRGPALPVAPPPEFDAAPAPEPRPDPHTYRPPPPAEPEGTGPGEIGPVRD